MMELASSRSKARLTVSHCRYSYIGLVVADGRSELEIDELRQLKTLNAVKLGSKLS